VQTDKPLYRPGETVRVRTWQLDATLHGIHDGGVRYDLLGPRGQLVATTLVEQQGGTATNDLVLAPSLAGGVYTVRATADDGQTAERTLVVNTYETPRLQKSMEFLRKAYVPGEMVVATVKVAGQTGDALVGRSLDARIHLDGTDLPAMAVTTDKKGEAAVRFRLPDNVVGGDGLLTVLVTDSGATESISRRIPITLDRLRVQMFPEGGELVAGLPSRVYFAATDPFGKPADVSGVLEDDHGTVLAPVKSAHHGLGRFELRPEPGRRYYLEIVGNRGRIELPAPQPAGCVLRTRDDFGSVVAYVRVAVQCTTAQDVEVAGTRQGRTFDRAWIHVSAGESATAYLSDGPEAKTFGLVRLTLSDVAGQPLAERLVARDRDQQLRLTLTPDRPDYLPGERVTLDVAAAAPSGEPVRADVSVAVVDDAVLRFADDKQGDIVTRMAFEAEFPTPVDEPRSFLSERTGYALDLLMGTAGWRTFVTRPSSFPQLAGAVAKADLPEGPVPGRPAPPPQTRAAQPRPPPATPPLPPAPGVGIGDLGVLGRKPDGPIAGVGGQPIILGALDKSLIDRDIKRNLNAIRYCYEVELRRNPSLAGNLVVRFTIAPDGSVSDARIKSSTIGSAPVEACVVERFRKLTFTEPKGGGVVIVSYPFLFAPGERREEVTPVYAKVRTFPEPVHLPDAPRSDFRDTVAWAPRVHTDRSGHATVSFVLSDAVTSFRAVAEGVGAGYVGRGEAVFAAKLPFDMVVKVPPAAILGDRLHLPLTLSNRRDAPVTVHVDAALGAPAHDVEVPAHDGRTLFYDVEARETMPVTFHASAAGLTDTFTRTLRVEEDGFHPRAWSEGGQLVGTARHTVEVVDPARGTANAWVKVYPGTLSTIVDGLDGLLTQPYGCFEQTSSVNYPNLLVLRYLQERGVVDLALATRTRALLEAGYTRLASFESRGGGFEWFGGPRAHPGLTAYGIAQLTDLKTVYAGVDPALVDRATTWILGRRDGQGGWRPDEREPWSLPGGQTQEDAYITWALVSSGLGPQLGLEVAAMERLSRETDDDYLLALATGSLTGPARAAAARRLAARQETTGAWTRAEASFTRSGHRTLAIEATALATLALVDDPAYAHAVDAAIGWLLRQRDGTGRWGSTQGTILTLKALVAYGAHQPARAPGSAVVSVDGAAAGELRWEDGDVAPPRLALVLSAGKHVVTLSQTTGTTPIPYVVGAAWTSRLPAPSPGVRVALTTHLDAATVGVGERVRLTAELRNPGAEPLPMTVARIGVPAGLDVQAWQLEELRKRGVVDFYETAPNAVIVYLRHLREDTTVTIPLDLLAAVPGTYTAPVSTAWVYYDDDVRAAAEALGVEVTAAP
jgi:uncharacterized protein YfaS (alpha-2-macroglobulin family)